MLLDIVILPPVKLRERLGQQVAKATRGIPKVFIVDNKKLIPHLSLFHIKISKERLEKLVNVVKLTIKKYQPIKIRSLYYYNNGRTVSLELSKAKTLEKLHEDTVIKCYTLRSGVMPWTGLGQWTNQKREYRKKYGTQHILKFFHPHFTLALLKSIEDAQSLVKQIQSFKFQFFGDTVAIAEVNFWHQVTRVIKKFKLK